MDRLQLNNTWSAPHKEHPCYVSFHAVQWFSNRRHLYVFPIGSYVKQSPPLAGSLMMDQLQSNNTWSSPHKEYSCHVWFHSIQWLKIQKVNDDDGRQVMRKANLAPGELKKLQISVTQRQQTNKRLLESSGNFRADKSNMNENFCPLSDCFKCFSLDVNQKLHFTPVFYL